MAQTNSPPEVTLDRMLRTLSDETRRSVLTTIAERNHRGVDELTPRDLVPDETALDQFRTVLYHRHLPELEAAACSPGTGATTPSGAGRTSRRFAP